MNFKSQKQYEKIKVRRYLIVIILGIPLFLYVFIFSKNRNKLYNQLDSEGIVDTAVIVRDFIGAKGKLYFEYQFKVDNQNCNGFLQYSPSHGDLIVGDSVMIKYLASDPDEINKILQKENYRLIKN